jgi:hypothetical protein
VSTQFSPFSSEALVKENDTPSASEVSAEVNNVLLPKTRALLGLPLEIFNKQNFVAAD